MNNVKKTLVIVFISLFFINIIIHNIYAQENNTTEISTENAINLQNASFSETPQKSEITKEDILIEAQRSIDRSLSILNIVATSMGVLVTILAIIIAIVGGLGFLEIKRWKENRNQIKEDVDFIKEQRTKVESYGNAMRQEVESFSRSPLTEKPSSEVREKLDDFSHRLETLEMLGGSLETKDYINRGYDLYFKGKYDLALKAYEKALELAPDDVSTWINKGFTLNTLGRLDEALKAFDKAIELNPYNVSAWYYKSVTLNTLGRFDEALKVCDMAIELDPAEASVWNNKGITLGTLGRFDEALKAFDKAIELKLNEASTWNNKGFTLNTLGRFDEALKAFDKAIELKPDEASTWNNKGFTFYKLGRFNEALKAFDKAIELKPDEISAWNNKRVTFGKLGAPACVIRGNVTSNNPKSKPSWDAQSFGGFFYNLKYDRMPEQLYITRTMSDLQASRTINKKELVYNTEKAPINFKVFEKEGLNVFGSPSYSLVGWMTEKWIAVNGKANKLVKLVFEMDKEDKKTLITGETWSLGSGYEMNINAIDARTTPKQVWFTIKKNGAIVDEGIGQAPVSTKLVDKQKAVFYKTKTILGESNALLFTVYVDSIISGATSDMVQFKYAWLIDESSAKEIKSGDKFGVFEVREASKDIIRLTNENDIILSKNIETTLMGDIKFLIADSDELRFYPFVAYTNPGKYEVRGSVVDADKTPGLMPTWDAHSFAGFYYDLKYNRYTETLSFISKNLNQYASSRSIDKEEFEYKTGKTDVDFKSFEKEGIGISNQNDTSYSLVGWQAEKWIAVNGKANKLVKLIFEMDKEDKKTLTTGETWALGSGYEVAINAIDARSTPRLVWFTIKKDGAIVDEGIGQAPVSTKLVDKQKAVFYKTKTILGESDALLFTVYVDTIFSGATSDMVQFKYAWLIDENSAKEIKAADKYGVFEVREASNDTIRLTNENAIILSKNTETTLMGNLKFKIADNDTLRFYPKVDYVIDEVRGSGYRH